MGNGFRKLLEISRISGKVKAKGSLIDKRNCDRIVGKNFNIGGKNDRSDIKIGEKYTIFYETMSASSNYN